MTHNPAVQPLPETAQTQTDTPTQALPEVDEGALFEEFDLDDIEIIESKVFA
ncbi:3-thiaglutamate biosynthesis pearlin carrier peptide TglA [Pseudomonas entomophila]|uniref:3-thiaglutamate biosynthesis pearlin carrier peptide TglA n=1 Tax=Pseudomonas entomophila TaxID=312306 RepID=UPI001F02D51F|nr:TglA family RiPP precursor [Pseudomonas entomophila]MCG8294973.1 TglA family RiPP precursor [Pseudomonas entomophila]